MTSRIKPVCGLSVKEHKWLRKKWHGMTTRCSPTYYYAHHYHARGITVEWPNFVSFVEYVVSTIGLPDLDSGTNWNLDRINNDASYSPGNIQWSTYTENLRNSRNNLIVDFRGEKLVLSVLAERFNMPYFLVHDRVTRQYWTPEEAVTTPKLAKHQRIKDRGWQAAHRNNATFAQAVQRNRETDT